MIELKMRRSKEGCISGQSRSVTIEEAVRILVICEIGFGGRVTHLSRTSVETSTHVIGCLDVTTFTGSEQDMALLVKASGISLQFRPPKQGVHLQIDPKVMQDISKITKRNPLITEQYNQIQSSIVLAKCILISMIGEYHSIKKLMEIKLEDLLTAMLMICKDGSNTKEVIDLATGD